MKVSAALVLAVLVAVPAFGQTAPKPLEVGATVESFEMVPDRTVIFEPTADGRIHILSSIDRNRHAPMPRETGHVAVAMTYALEIGAVIEFNSGLDHAFAYEAHAVGGGEDLKLATCPVRGNAVAADQWPEGFKSVRIGPLRRVDGAAVCDAPGG